MVGIVTQNPAGLPADTITSTVTPPANTPAPFSAPFTGLVQGTSPSNSSKALAWRENATFAELVNLITRAGLTPDAENWAQVGEAVEKLVIAGQATVSSVAMANANVTLTQAQYDANVLIVTGVLTANVDLIFPTQTRSWVVIDKTTGAFAVTAKTAAGAGAELVSGANLIAGDGINILSTQVVLPVATDTTAGIARIATQAEVNAGTGSNTIVTPERMRLGFSASLTPNGYIAFPTWLGGFILQWGAGVGLNNASRTITFPIAFPSACYGVQVTADFVGNPTNLYAVGQASNISATSFDVRIGLNGDANATGQTTAAAFWWFSIGI